MVLAIERFPRGIAVLACLCVALVAGWAVVRREGVRKLLAAALTAVALVAAAVLLVVLGGIVGDLLVVGAFAASVSLARVAFRVHVDLPKAPRPHRPVLFFNPRSGGGKAKRFCLVEEARRRGIVPMELAPGEDLRELVQGAIEDGADALAMAGGDGSQAVVAEMAAARGLPYACIPAGTRNHFALDLGVDRDDVVGALDAFVDGGERRVDLAEVNGRVFVNNVSIGLYADAVQRPGYRDAKLRTLLEAAPEGLHPEASAGALRWSGPEGDDGRDPLALLVSNNVYRLGPGIGSGTRPRLDRGLLGVAAATPGVAGPGGVPVGVRLRQWDDPIFTIDADGPVAAGIDGEAVTLAPPLCFASKPGVLAVRIAPGHPGASPSTEVPRGLRQTVAKLARIAIGGRLAFERGEGRINDVAREENGLEIELKR
ncbi:MAG TPA: diacylglycerol kinase family protein [Solirubrobacterales bacterium]|nr:diacylglycerol kinase family protein [Solirubrobacterales bacterium]